MNSLLLGAIAMASLVAALFFLRFWRDTHDRFFLLFAIAFLVEALNRAALGLTNIAQEQEPCRCIFPAGVKGCTTVPT